MSQPSFLGVMCGVCLMKAPIVYESAMLFHGIGVFPIRLAPKSTARRGAGQGSKRANSRKMERCRFQREAPRFSSLCEATRHCAFRVVNSSGQARLSSNMRHLLESDKKRQSTVCSLCFTRDRTRRFAIGWILAAAITYMLRHWRGLTAFLQEGASPETRGFASECPVL
jgi:hypothetical protein